MLLILLPIGRCDSSLRDGVTLLVSTSSALAGNWKSPVPQSFRDAIFVGGMGSSPDALSEEAVCPHNNL